MRLPIRLAALASLFLLGSAVLASTTAAPPQNVQDVNATEAYVTDNTSGYAEAELSASAPESRDSRIAGCVTDTSLHLPQGTDTNLFCTCAIDKMTASGGSYRDAVFQCAAQMRFATPQLRASEISECISGAPGHLPEGADANAFCTCAVDKMLTSNTPQRDAVNQCAAEQHINMLSGVED